MYGWCLEFVLMRANILAKCNYIHVHAINQIRNVYSFKEKNGKGDFQCERTTFNGASNATFFLKHFLKKKNVSLSNMTLFFIHTLSKVRYIVFKQMRNNTN